MSTNKQYSDKTKMSDLTATAFVLLALHDTTDRAGLTLAKITRYITSKTPLSVSSYRVEKILHILVKSQLVDVDVQLSLGGRFSRKYLIVGAGLLCLLAYAHNLPKRERVDMYTVYAPTYERFNAMVEAGKAGVAS